MTSHQNYTMEFAFKIKVVPSEKKRLTNFYTWNGNSSPSPYLVYSVSFYQVSSGQAGLVYNLYVRTFDFFRASFGTG